MPEKHISNSPEQTREIACSFAERLPSGAVVALHGEMGAGKTCFAQGAALALGVRADVISPTFTLINEYEAERPLYHVDLYRVKSEAEALELGLDDYTLRGGIMLIEWPERAAGWFDNLSHWRVEIMPGATRNERIISLEAPP